jgi:disulfide bond formation protein DsbB
MPFALLVAALAAAAPLIARASEIWPGLAPCALCLWQRWPYWIAAAIALAAAFAPERWRPWLLRAAGLAVLVSGGIAMLHVGVEQGWWPSPLPACQAFGVDPNASVEEMMRSLAPRPNKPCDEPTYLIPGLPLSIPAFNLIYALALAAFTFRGAGRKA